MDKNGHEANHVIRRLDYHESHEIDHEEHEMDQSKHRMDQEKTEMDL